MTTEQARQLDIVAFLEQQNIRPVKVTGHQYWYYSPFRNERTPSFKVNRLFNLWFDFGENKGGTLIDLGIRLKNCTVKDFLGTLNDGAVSGKASFSFGRQHDKGNTDFRQKPAIKILSVHLINSYALVQYLQSRRINIEIADKYLQEVHYQNSEKIYYALGFKNDQGGYELRSPYFKGSSSPKGITFIDNKASELAVFEGCFDFLSYLCFMAQREHQNENYLVLNSISFFKKQLTDMQQFSRVKLFLDNDNAGDKATALALSLTSKKFIDKRNLFAGSKDFNEWWKLRPPD